jgi:HAD superfamily hydrolase (TIGR01509 family)
MDIRALIFDVDGTLAETENIHRAAFNTAFARSGLNWSWSVDLYRELLRVTGGKERIRRYANMRGLSSTEISDDIIAHIHALKNARYAEIVRQGDCAPRPGVERLIRTSHARGLRLAICTTTSRANVYALIAATLGADGQGLFRTIAAGEDVRQKKPAPDAYLRAVEELDVEACYCLAFEDSRNGLRAALAANVKTIVTLSLYTAHKSFEGAARVLPDLSQFDLVVFTSEALPMGVSS